MLGDLTPAPAVAVTGHNLPATSHHDAAAQARCADSTKTYHPRVHNPPLPAYVHHMHIGLPPHPTPPSYPPQTPTPHTHTHQLPALLCQQLQSKRSSETLFINDTAQKRVQQAGALSSPQQLAVRHPSTPRHASLKPRSPQPACHAPPVTTSGRCPCHHCRRQQQQQQQQPQQLSGHQRYAWPSRPVTWCSPAA
jgi:hypothetical protein